MHKILILGPQGSGKGTQAERLSARLKIPALSMGALLRDEIASGSDLGKEIDAIINQRGELVADHVALSVLERRLKQSDAENGYILDGYPRNQAQFEAFDVFDKPTAVVVIDVPRNESLKRLTKRSELEARADDTPEIINKRLSIYEESTKPIIDQYAMRDIVHRIDGVGTMDDVEERIVASLGI
ncbi:MAG: nucleoside monophosphate kinase [Patescibacteria group bacterium]|jgi:adenylate kinase